MTKRTLLAKDGGFHDLLKLMPDELIVLYRNFGCLSNIVVNPIYHHLSELHSFFLLNVALFIIFAFFIFYFLFF